jgi:O-succinylbenzoic acid--CoA ligase
LILKSQNVNLIFTTSIVFQVTDRVPDTLKTFAVEPWQQEVIAFLEQWLDANEYVEVKTSGSTGEPKVIRLPKQTMLRSAQMTNARFSLTENSFALLSLPASYIAGKMMLVRALAGNYSLMAVQPSANPFSNPQLHSKAFDFAAITPYQLVHSANDIPLCKVRNCIVGGSPVTLAMEELVQVWPVALYETFGMTETASHIALRRFNGEEKSNFFETLDGVTLSMDERGCLEIDAPHLHTEKLVTNDLVELIDARHFRWLGRFDRVVNSGGVKIFPEQVERKIQDLIDLPFFIASVSHPALGQQLILVIESENLPEHLQNEILEILRTRLDKYEIPGKLICIANFVYSSGNKLLRNETLSRIG